MDPPVVVQNGYLVYMLSFLFAFQNPLVDFKATFERGDKEARGVIREPNRVIVNKP